ncbi:MAG TPA: 6-bladed beta-propeller, partial [Anaerolineales bacterium]|nr:6-bladed beta-propeller [Anaerolineales bacterium]
MTKVKVLWFLSVALLSACSNAEPSPTSTPEPTTTPTSTPIPMPSQVSEINLPDDPMNAPYGIAVNSLGNLYVNDAGNNRVLIFDADGNLLSKWDTQGSGDGEFKTLGFGSLAIDADDNVFIVDNGNSRIQKFDKDG